MVPKPSSNNEYRRTTGRARRNAPCHRAKKSTAHHQQETKGRIGKLKLKQRSTGGEETTKTSKKEKEEPSPYAGKECCERGGGGGGSRFVLSAVVGRENIVARLPHARKVWSYLYIFDQKVLTIFRIYNHIHLYAVECSTLLSYTKWVKMLLPMPCPYD